MQELVGKSRIPLPTSNRYEHLKQVQDPPWAVAALAFRYFPTSSAIAISTANLHGSTQGSIANFFQVQDPPWAVAALAFRYFPTSSDIAISTANLHGSAQGRIANFFASCFIAGLALVEILKILSKIFQIPVQRNKTGPRYYHPNTSTRIHLSDRRKSGWEHFTRENSLRS